MPVSAVSIPGATMPIPSVSITGNSQTPVFSISIARLFGIYLLCSSHPSISAPTDSLAYALAREELRQHEFLPDEYSAYLETADQLASEGLFAEAYAVIDGIAEEDSLSIGALLAEIENEPEMSYGQRGFADPAVPVPQQSRRSRRVSWRITTGATFDQYDDGLSSDDWLSDSLSAFDDSLFSIDSVDDGSRSFTARIRVAAKLEDLHSMLDNIEPSFYFSNTRAQGGLSVQGAPVQGILSYKVDAAAQKKLGEDYGDSSDVLRGEMSLIGSTARFSNVFRLSIPLKFSGEWYRFDRPSYAGYNKYSLSPSLSLALGETFLQLMWDHEHTRYSNEFRDGNTVATGPQLQIDLFLNSLSAMVTIEATREWYPGADAPTRRDALLSTFDMRATPTSKIEFSVRGIASTEREWYPDQLIGYDSLSVYRQVAWDSTGERFTSVYDTIFSYADTSLSYHLAGTTLQLIPSLRFKARNWYFQPEVEINRLWYPSVDSVDDKQLSYALSLWESSFTWGPMFRFGYTGERLYWELSGGYRTEDIIDPVFSEDNSEFCAGGELSWQAVPWIGLDASVSMQYRVFETRQEMDTYLSLTSSIKF